MKKTLFTLSCVAFFGFMAQAQSHQQAPASNGKSESVQPDGTLAPAKADNANPSNSTTSRRAHSAPNTLPGEKVQTAPNAAKADKTQTAPDAASQPAKDRHAITEKGVPASKSKEQKPAEKKPGTTEKH